MRLGSVAYGDGKMVYYCYRPKDTNHDKWHFGWTEPVGKARVYRINLLKNSITGQFARIFQADKVRNSLPFPGINQLPLAQAARYHWRTR